MFITTFTRMKRMEKKEKKHNVYIPEKLHHAIKMSAIINNTSIQKITEEVLEKYLKEKEKEKNAKRI